MIVLSGYIIYDHLIYSKTCDTIYNVFALLTNGNVFRFEIESKLVFKRQIYLLLWEMKSFNGRYKNFNDHNNSILMSYCSYLRWLWLMGREITSWNSLFGNFKWKGTRWVLIEQITSCSSLSQFDSKCKKIIIST